jgi:hypothetical protein
MASIEATRAPPESLRFFAASTIRNLDENILVFAIFKNVNRTGGGGGQLFLK